MITSHFKLIFTLVTTSFLLSSCTVGLTPKDGSKAVAEYQANTLVTYINESMDSTFGATISSLDELDDYFRTGEIIKEKSTTVIARKMGDTKVHIKLIKVSAEETEVRVRIGILGNIPESQILLTHILNKL